MSSAVESQALGRPRALLPDLRPMPEEAAEPVGLSQRERIARLSRIRELVCGGQDGLLSTLGLLTGLAGAAAGTTAIIVAGVAAAAAGALSMSTGAWLASRAENQLFQSEIDREEAALRDRPELEMQELERLLRKEGLDPTAAGFVAAEIAASPTSFVKTMVEKRLGLPYGDVATALGDAGVVAGAFVAGAFVPLGPYLFFGQTLAVPLSIGLTGAALFVLGIVKGRVARLALLRSGVEVLIVGGVAAGVGYLIGSIAQLG
jgi:VIT1/CCC1 family predicted Fe2+/Mn2+ transporter